MPRNSRRSDQWTVYVLKDPRDGAIRYVGQTFALLQRMRAHERDCQRNSRPLYRWLADLGEAGLIPVYEIMETGSGDVTEAECRWIARMRSEGASLTNCTDGGPGQSGNKHSETTKRKKSESQAGMKRSPEFCAKMRELAKLRPPEHKEKLIANNKARAGKKLSPEARAKMSAAKAGKPWSSVRRMAMEENGHPCLGKPKSAETRAKMSAGVKRARTMRDMANKSKEQNRVAA